MKSNATYPSSEDDDQKQKWSKKCTNRKYVKMASQYILKSGLSLLGLVLINLFSKSSVFARCAKQGFNESDSSCYSMGASFFALSVFRLVLAILPTVFTILTLTKMKKARKGQIITTLPYLIVSIALAVAAIAYFVGILYEVV